MSETPTTQPRPERVTLFATCMVDQLAPGVGESTIEVLEYLGLEVDFLSDQTCCAQPAFNSGFRSEAFPVAKRFVELFEQVEGPIVVPSVDCLIITPICPHTLAMRPLVVPGTQRVGVSPIERTKDLVVTADGQVVNDFETGAEIHIERSEIKIPLVRFAGQNFKGILDRN